MYRKIAVFIVTIMMVLSLGSMHVEAARGKTVNLGATMNLKVQTKEAIKWSSNNKNVVSVNKTGKITAKRVGRAIIKGKGNKKTYKFYITVVDPHADSTKLQEAKNYNIEMIAHRGMSSLAPENTLQAIKLAATYGFKMVEFDISQTKDGKFIVMHDKTIDRTTNGKGEISKLTYKQVKAFKIKGGNGYSDRFKNVEIPSLEQTLKLCKKHNLTPLIHIKSVSDTSSLLKILKNSGFSNKAILCSSNTNTLLEIKAANKKAKLMIVESKDGQFAVNFAKENKLMGINISSKALDLQVVNTAKQEGMTVYVWDVYSKARFDTLKEYGIDGVVSNGVLK